MSDPIHDENNLINDKWSKHRIVGRLAVLTYLVAYLWVIFTCSDEKVIWSVGVLGIIIFLIYTAGVDALEQVGNILLKMKR